MSDKVYTIDEYKQKLIKSVNSSETVKRMVQDNDFFNSVTDDNNVVTDMSIDMETKFTPEMRDILKLIIDGVKHD